MLKDTGEFGLIDKIRKSFPVPSGVTGIGDDCAILPGETGKETLISTDMLVEGVHFLLSDITPYQLGWKSAAVNMSDIAAMGASPKGTFLALSLPPEVSDEWVDDFLKGYGDVSEEYGFPLLGGDTTSSKSGICICVTAVGESLSCRSVRRDGAVPGDLICVTGTLGDSAAGLEIVLKGIGRESEESGYLLGKHYLPRPRIEQGLRLADCAGVHSMMDISDGIASDLRHILEESGVGAEVDVDLIPLSPQLKSFCGKYSIDIQKLALCGGEDYELLFTIGEDSEAQLDIPHTVIGRITDGRDLVWKGTDKDYIGYRHF